MAEVTNGPLHYTEAPAVGARVWFVDGWDNIRVGVVSRVDGNDIAIIEGNDDDPLYNRFSVVRPICHLYRSYKDCLMEELEKEMTRHELKVKALLYNTAGTYYTPIAHDEMERL